MERRQKAKTKGDDEVQATGAKITVRPVTLGRFSTMPVNVAYKKRVAAYARVSTDSEEQLSSYDAQVKHYSNFIKQNPAWEFVEVYSDEGILATSTKNRDGFNTMIADALNGKIDLIITKSVSRMARNTVDSLTIVRQLKERGIEIYFEKENIYTLDSKGELLITIMSSLAQEESRSISENVTWGQRKRFADGKVSLPYKSFLGFEKGEDGIPKIVESQAKIVRLIYKLYLEGKTYAAIAKYLTSENIPTPAKKTKWSPSTVESILQNEKYKGDAVLQKSFTVDFLTKKTKVNEGEIPQYYVQNSHPAIIAPEVYDLVQVEIKKRKEFKGYKTASFALSGKIVCGECGSFFGSKVWHSTSKYKRTIWQCNSKFKNDKKCGTTHLSEEKIKAAFVEVFNRLYNKKEEILEGYEEILRVLTDTTALEKEGKRLLKEQDVVLEDLRRCVDENARTAIDQAEYQKKYNALAKKHESIGMQISEIENKKLERSAKRESIKAFLEEIRQRDGLLVEFDDELWNAVVERVVVGNGETVRFEFKDGMGVEWGI